MHVLLDHTAIADQLTIRKDREYAACRICGAIYQSYFNTTHVSDEEYKADPLIAVAAAIETAEWREQHNKRHSEAEHIAFRRSGRTLSPIAAQRLAPFGLVSLDQDDETTCALLGAKAIPSDDIETTRRSGAIL